MSNLFYHKQWNKIKFLFEKQKRVGRPTLNPRKVFEAIVWILKSGARWRDLPKHYGNWNSIYHTFRRWIKQGIFEKILRLINQEIGDYSLLEMDSTFCKVHQNACSNRKNQEIGSSRGGKNTKIHVLVTENFQLLNVKLSGGQINDCQKATDLLGEINITGKTILADKAYDTFVIRKFIKNRNGVACIPNKANSAAKYDFDKEIYKKRNIVERFFQRIKNYRRVAFRFDKLAVCFLNFVLLAAFLIHF